jgi:L-ascorbate metabolism protein UlaG (beta-lactamase superfamily)
VLASSENAGGERIAFHGRNIQLTVSMSRQHPTVWRKLKQLWGVVRESHRVPMAGISLPPTLVSPDDLGITFIGHSSFLVQIANRSLLIDPVFATRLILLRRARRPGLRLEDLPPIDAVLLTHAHMDHLNIPSLRRIVRHTLRITGVAPRVIVPRGVGDLVAKLGFRGVTELEWWDSASITADTPEEDLTVTMTPCKHWGARMFSDIHRHYGGYVIAGAEHSVYHSGDTAYFPGFREIGEMLQPKVALLPIGAYFPDSYRAVHTSPEEALQAFFDLGSATTMIPMHFGTFPLGREPMEEPPVRLMQAARSAGVADRVNVLQEGQMFVEHSAVGSTAQ